ncbi:hypothetical protein AAG906_038079 [Vitis piasezkii]
MKGFPYGHVAFGGRCQKSGGKSNISPLRVCSTERKIDQKGTSDFFLLEEGRDDRARKKRDDKESWSEILKLLNIIRERKDCFERVTGKKRKCQKPSRFDHELKKLEWSMNYCGIEGDPGHQEGTTRGFVVFWDNRVLQMVEMEVGKFIVSCRFKNLGDFNMIRFPSERSKGGRMSPAMRRFSEGTIQVVLVRPVSDHSLILLDGGGMRRGPTPFRFENIEIKEEVSRTFQGLLANLGDWKPGIDGLNFERLEEVEVEGLEKPFSEDEVFEALVDCCGKKTPGPEGAEDLKDFRPISLVGGLYKWLAKVMANRLKGVLAKVISMSQNAFVEGQQIMNAVLIANEAIDSILKSKRGAILCKLDIEKAYDHPIWKKNELIPVDRVKNVEELANEFGYNVRNLPSTYLGMPLGAPFKSIGAWDGIEERF